MLSAECTVNIHSAFYGYLRERRDYLEFNGYYDKPELPEDADEDDIEYIVQFHLKVRQLDLQM